jgi:hypothetical protein
MDIRQTRMTEQPLDARRERAQRDAVARQEARRRRAIFRPCMKIARAKRNGREICHVVGCQSASTCQPHFHPRAAADVLAGKARRNCRGVVGNHEVAAA